MDFWGGEGFFGGQGILWGQGIFGGREFFRRGITYPIFFCTNLIVRVKLDYPPNINFLGKPLLGERYVEGRKKKKKEEEEK